ncbi:putative transcription factor TGA like domain-containing protein [Rosa chinensis]|uniref:Putative transcription factor TGA like domain-containing protein n=1 Tax=Rosa chinensis TaxID=74649 RepID=A0A2P6Q4S0_ROSCH|nr:protein DELAY OF GERMINATION 1 [Rosa chinensis]PRQ29175.1 putative transcription factor TGA like domain-containing protein [Rosa chinensis]
MASGDREESKCCFKEWMTTQEEDLSELFQALTVEPENIDQLKQLAEKSITHFQDYIKRRNKLAHKDISAYFAPNWCSPWENSLLWVAGCRPSLFFRLVYALSGSEVESNLTEFLLGTKEGYLGEVMSSTQLLMINALQSKTISEEERLTMKLAALQEDIADQPIAMIAKGLSKVGEMNGEVEKVLDNHGRQMVKVLEEADGLRMNTLKELVKILSPLQAVDFLVASKKLHLCVHNWGRQRDQKLGRKEIDEEC